MRLEEDVQSNWPPKSRCIGRLLLLLIRPAALDHRARGKVEYTVHTDDHAVWNCVSAFPSRLNNSDTSCNLGCSILTHQRFKVRLVFNGFMITTHFVTPFLQTRHHTFGIGLVLP